MQSSNVAAKKIRIRQLRCFVTVARKRSFVLAADELGLTQPAVSRSVRELEQVLGHDLIDRSMRGAELTDRGRVFLDAAEAGLLQIWQGAQAVVGDLSTNETIRIGALPNVCTEFLPNVIYQYKSLFPEVMVRVTPGANVDLLNSLRRGEADFVIGRLSSSEDMKGLTFEALFDEPLIFASRKGHPLASERESLQEAVAYPLVLPPEGTIIRQELSRFLATHGITQLANVIETTSSDFQRTYLSMSDAIAVVPRGVMQDDINEGTVVRLEIGVGEMLGPVGLTTNPDLRPSEAAESLRNIIRNQEVYTEKGM